MTNQEVTTRRQRRIAARRAQILEAAANVFREKGYARATTKEIAIVADVSEGSLYYYFDNKRDLLIGLVQDFANETVEAIADIQGEDVEDMIIQLVAGRFQHMRKKRMFTLFLHEARMDPEIRRYYVEEVLARFISKAEQRIQSFIAAGIMRPVNPAIAARTLVGAMIGFAVMFEMENDDMIETASSEALAAGMLDIFFNGLNLHPAVGEGEAL